MKSNEAPEKIYMSPAGVLYKGDKQQCNDIEYTRTDVFIEKALKWYCLDCECNDNCKDIKCFFHNEYKRFLEENKNACPPKFECTILNPDGSTSDKWRYRHFIRKMQDAFIEKACEGIEHLLSGYIIRNFHFGDSYEIDALIEDFKNYMKGE